MNFLENIIDVKKEEVRELKRKVSKRYFTERETFNKKGLSLAGSIMKSGSFGIIGEIKKASPSKGILRNDFNPFEIAEEYCKAGVNGLSILTDKQFFKGDIKYLESIAENKTVPLLRKDFIIDEIQIFEAKAAGADAILLICEILTAYEILDLSETARSIGLEILLELHSEKELMKIDFSTIDLIGINNRNLETFEVSLDTSINIIASLPKEAVKISESGLNSIESITKIKNAGFNGALIGEFFMKSANIKKSLEDLTGVDSNEN